jgi:hypothetical protein
MDIIRDNAECGLLISGDREGFSLTTYEGELICDFAPQSVVTDESWVAICAAYKFAMGKGAREEKRHRRSSGIERDIAELKAHIQHIYIESMKNSNVPFPGGKIQQVLIPRPTDEEIEFHIDVDDPLVVK